MKKLKRKLLTAFASASVFATGASAGEEPHRDISPSIENNATTCQVPEGMIGGRVYRERSCATLNDFLENPEAYAEERFYAPLMTIFNANSVGREMLENAAQGNVRICDMELSNTVAAVYNHNSRRVGVEFSRDRTEAEFMMSILHEITHYYQGINNSLSFNYRRPLVQNQRAMLARETAAPVMELVALFDAYRAGTVSLEGVHNAKSAEMRVFEGYYDSNMLVLGDHEQALNLAAQQMWRFMFYSQHRLNHYNKSAIRFTLLNISRLVPEDINHPQAEVDHTLDTAGRISEALDFTSSENMPSDQALFGNNLKMQEIFAAVEWYRQSRMLGHDDVQVRHEWARLRNVGNRYVDADFESVTCQIRQGADVIDAFTANYQARSVHARMGNRSPQIAAY